MFPKYFVTNNAQQILPIIIMTFVNNFCQCAKIPLFIAFNGNVEPNREIISVSYVIKWFGFKIANCKIFHEKSSGKIPELLVNLIILEGDIFLTQLYRY